MHFITISRKLGSNGTDVARQVADALGYRYIDTAAIDAAAKEMGYLESVEEADERSPSFFQRFFSQRPVVNVDRLNAIMYELAEKGDAVFVGRGGHILLKSFDCALHVRVIASRENRIMNLVSRGYEKSAAAREIDRSDHERAGFIKFAFHADWDDPLLYDTVLNMDKIDVETAVESVLSMARSSAIKACSVDALAIIDKMALTELAEAAIIDAGLGYGRTVAVSAHVDEPGVVRLEGVADEPVTRKKAEEIVRKLRGVQRVDNHIKITPADRHA